MKIIELKEYLSATRNRNERFSLYRKLWSQTSNTEILTDFPLHLDIELAGICNLKCENCYQNGYITGRLGLMDFNMYKGIINQSLPEGLCSIKLQIRGESFLHPRLIECIRYAKQAGVMDIQITTNATLLTEKMARSIFDSGLDGIIFSVDGHHDDAWGKPKNAKVCSRKAEVNVKNFLKLRTKLNKTMPWARIQVCIPEADNEVIVTNREYIAREFPGVDASAISRIHDFSDSRDSYPDLHINYTFLPCKYLFQRLAVFWDGSVTACCMDYNNRFQLGDITCQSIKEIWLGEKIQAMRNKHKNSERKTINICNHCHVCLKPKKETIVQVLHPLSPDTVG